MLNFEINLVDVEWSQLKRGAYRQSSAIWALVFKEYKIRLGKSRIGLFWALFEPVVGMLMLGSIRYASGHSYIQHVHVLLFVGVGFIIFNAFRIGLQYIPHAIIANQGLLNYPQVKPIDTIFARFILGNWLHLLASLFMLIGVWWMLGEYARFPDPLFCFQNLGIATFFGFGVSLPITVFGTLNENVLKMIGIISMPLVILSAVLFSMNEMPQSVREILAWNPLVHLVEGFRHGAFGTKLFPEYSFTYPMMCTLVSVGLGYVIYHFYRFRLIMK